MTNIPRFCIQSSINGPIYSGGVIIVAFATTAPAQESGGDKLPLRKYIIIGSLILCILLVVAFIIVLIILKKRSKMTDAEKMRARKNKEKAKRAKLEAKASKKKNK